MHDHEPTIDVIRELGALKVGASHPQRMALLVVVGSHEPIALGDVTRRIGMSRAATTTIIDSLVNAKLIKRVHDIGDRRTIHVEATALGRRAVARAEKAAGLSVAA